MKPSAPAPTALLLAASLRTNLCAEKACSQAAESPLACAGPTFAEWAACICPHSSWPEVIAACVADCEPLNPAFLQFCVGSSIPVISVPEVTLPPELTTTSADSNSSSYTEAKTTAADRTESEVPKPEPEPAPPAPTETHLPTSQLPDPATTTPTLTLTPTPARPKYTVTGHAVPFAPTPDTCTRLASAALAAVAAVGAVSIVVWA